MNLAAFQPPPPSYKADDPLFEWIPEVEIADASATVDKIPIFFVDKYVALIPQPISIRSFILTGGRSSREVILYSHANAEDLKQIVPFIQHLASKLQVLFDLDVDQVYLFVADFDSCV